MAPAISTVGTPKSGNWRMEAIAGQQGRDNLAFIAIDNRNCMWSGMDGEAIDVPMQALFFAIMPCESCQNPTWTIGVPGIGIPARVD